MCTQKKKIYETSTSVIHYDEGVHVASPTHRYFRFKFWVFIRKITFTQRSVFQENVVVVVSCFCFVLFLFVFVLFCFVLFCFVFVFVLFCFVLLFQNSKNPFLYFATLHRLKYFVCSNWKQFLYLFFFFFFFFFVFLKRAKFEIKVTDQYGLLKKTPTCDYLTFWYTFCYEQKISFLCV